MNYVQLKVVPEPKAARFGRIEAYDRAHDLRSGESLREGFPADAAYRMSKEYPNLIALYDFLPVMGSVLVVSQAARQVIEAGSPSNVEFLPVAVVNHKGRKEKAPYFIANLVGLVDCADPKKTKFTPNALDADLWMNVTNLTVVEKQIPAPARLFRVMHLPSLVLVHRELAQTLKDAKLRGFQAGELSEYRWS